MKTYSLTILGTRRVHLNFDSIDDLIEELEMRLTQTEKDCGCIERLLAFKPRLVSNDGFTYHYSENGYRNMTVTCVDYN